MDGTDKVDNPGQRHAPAQPFPTALWNPQNGFEIYTQSHLSHVGRSDTSKLRPTIAHTRKGFSQARAQGVLDQEPLARLCVGEGMGTKKLWASQPNVSYITSFTTDRRPHQCTRWHGDCRRTSRNTSSIKKTLETDGNRWKPLWKLLGNVRKPLETVDFMK